MAQMSAARIRQLCISARLACRKWGRDWQVSAKSVREGGKAQSVMIGGGDRQRLCHPVGGPAVFGFVLGLAGRDVHELDGDWQ